MEWNDFLPHAYCIGTPWLVLSHAVLDTAIGIAYLFISAYLARTIRYVSGTLAGVRLMIALFVFWCALTHFMDVAVLWWPAYYIQLAVKLVTASVSAATAVMMYVYSDVVGRALGRYD